MSSTLLGSGGLLYPQQSLRAQDLPPASEMLDRGARLYDQKNYADAKKILMDINPALLSEDQRARRQDLLTKTDQALSAAMGPNQRLDDAQQDMDAGRLANASMKFQAIAADSSTPADVKDKANIQLALVKQKQAEQAPAMKQLLDQAQSLYDQGKLDDSQDALNKVQAVGADLGWDNMNRIPQLQQRIAEKKMAMARGNGAGNTLAAVTPPAQGAAVNPPATATAVTPNPMDVMPTSGGSSMAMTMPAGTMPAETTAGEGGVLQEEIASDQVRRERAKTLYDQALRDSDDSIQQNQYQQAIARAQEALDIASQNRNYFSDVEGDALRSAAQAKLDNAKLRYQMYQDQQQTVNEQRVREAQQSRIAILKSQRQQKVAQLVADARKLYESSQFAEAADLLTQATVIDPQDENAHLMLRLVQDKVVARQAEEIMHRTGQEMMRQSIANDEIMIPYADLMVYPDNWPEITRKRGGGSAAEDTAANRVARERLEENMAVISADNTALEKVLNFIRDNMGANIFVNWPALQTAGIDRNTPVSVNLKEVPYRKVLTTILAQVGGGTANLSYTIDDGIITISTKDDLSSQKYQLVRVFDVRDMLVQPNNIPAPALNLQNVGSNTGTVSGAGGGGFGGGTGGGGLFNQTGQGQNQQSLQQQRTDLVNSIMDTIKSTVSRDTWVDNGGTIGTVRELNGQLIVNQTVDNQVAVFNLLQQLRETRAIQIAIEARVLLVTNSFLDDFRIGWDLSIPSGLIGGNVGAFDINNLNSFTQTSSGNFSTGVPGSVAPIGLLPTLNLSASIIDNWTLNILLAATQADKRTISVTAPRVTLFNGQEGWIAVTQDQNYVQSFNQTAAAGGIGGNAATATQLNIGQITTGVVLDVTATVSADRRYVVMTVYPTLRSLDGIDTFTVGSTATNGTNTTSNGSGNTTTATNGAFVQLPKTSFTGVNTMVSIPDGGTLLIGGQKLVGTEELEIGVPILSKIPGLNRLFTNRAYVKDERTLLVLVRPSIIIHREIENDLFGPGYDRPTDLPGNSGSSPTGGLMPIPAPSPGGH